MRAPGEALPKVSASPSAQAGEVSVNERMPQKLRAFQRAVAVDRLLGVQARFKPLLKHLCQIATQGLGVERAMLALVTSDTDHYPLQRGFEPPLEANPHAQGATLCHHVIDMGLPLVIDDTHASAPWRDIGSVRHGGVHAYLGVPVRFQGEVVGSLCVVAPQARHWQDHELALLASVGLMAEQAFDGAWREELAEHCAEQTRQRLQALEAGIIQRQMAFRDIRQALALQVAKMRIAPEGSRPSDVESLERLHDRLGEVNEGVLSDLGSATVEVPQAQTSFAELLALAVHVVAPARITLTAQTDPMLLDPVEAARQPALLRLLVTLLQESVRALPPHHALQIGLQAVDGVAPALTLQAQSPEGDLVNLPATLLAHITSMILEPMNRLQARLWASENSPGQLLLTWSPQA